MQTGMIGYTNCPAVRSHAEEAMRLAVIGETHHPTYTSGEQTYETQALKSDAGRVRFQCFLFRGGGNQIENIYQAICIRLLNRECEKEKVSEDVL